MRLFVPFVIVLLASAGCVSVDLGQASKDWAGVGKSFADSYKKGGQAPPAGVPAQQIEEVKP